MSQASVSRTIKFVSKAGTYTASIMSPMGDLYIDYEGNPNTDEVTVSPDFGATNPILYFVCISSRVAQGIADPESMQYYFNDQLITFSGGVSLAPFAGVFKTVAPSGDQLYYGLQIMKDISALAGYVPATIKMVARISYGNQSDSIQSSYTIPIQKATGSSYRVTIASGDTKNFVITEKGGSCILKAMVYQSGSEIKENLTYTWEKMTYTGWEAITTAKSQTLTINEADINTYGEYRVTVQREGTVFGSDVQSVMDASDPYDIDPHPVPADETIGEDEGDNSEVVYTPIVVKRGSSTKALDTQFYFAVRGGAGEIVNGDNNVAKSSYAVTRAHCLQAGGDVSLLITSVV